MANDIHYCIRAKEFKMLMQAKCSYVLVSSVIERTVAKGKEVFIQTSYAEGCDEHGKVLIRVAACPCPPCKPQQDDSNGE